MAYAKATSLSVNFLIPENGHMVKEFEEAREREEQSTGFARAEM